MGDGLSGGGVWSIVALDGHLLAVGSAQPAPGSPFVPAAWTSGDRGLSWTRSASTDLGLAGLFGPSVVVSQGTVLVRMDHALARSTDGGATWEALAFPGADDGATIFGLEAAGDTVLATGTVPGAPTFNEEWAATYLSSDAGTTWRRVDPLLTVPGDDGAEVVLGPLRGVVEVDGDLIATAMRNADNEDNQEHLLRSTDGGRTWVVADLGVTCPNPDPSGQLGSPAVAGRLVVVTYGCSTAGGRLLASTDGGRTWHEVRDERLGGRIMEPPSPSGEGRVSLLAGSDAVVHVSLRT